MDDPDKRIDRASNALKDSVHLLIDSKQSPSARSRPEQANAYAGMREIGVIQAQVNLLGSNTGEGKAANLDLPIPHRYSA